MGNRVFRLPTLLALSLFGVMLVLPRVSPAAITEQSLLEDINHRVSVMRFLHLEVVKAQENLVLVRAARELTQRQLDVQQRLFDSETQKGRPEIALIYKKDLDRLTRQMTKLNEFDFDKMYNERIGQAKKLSEQYAIELDTQLKGYEALFGRRPRVDIDFEKQASEQYRGKRAEAAYFLNLD